MNDAKKKARKKKLIRIAVIIAIVAVILTVAVIILRQQVTKRYGSSGDDVQSASATVGSLSTTVSGSGNLVDMDVEDLELSSAVTVKELYVKAGDKITEGELLADVDMATVLSAMNKLQEELDGLDDGISDAAADSVSGYITASVSGRVKGVYVEVGDNVASAMYQNGALMKLSLDGYMAVDIDCGTLSAGESVSVECSDGTRYDAAVDSCGASGATVLLTDNGPKDGDNVTVYSGDGSALGSGELYVHQALSVTGFTGTVKSVNVSENSSVRSGLNLITLSDTSYSGNYDSLLNERGELEEQLVQLITIYKEGALYAHSSGSVSSVADTSSTDDSESELQTIMSICPDKTMTVAVSVDESDILSLSVGQSAVVTVDSLGSDEYQGTVTEIETKGTASSGVTYYTVTVTLDKADKMLSGMTASVVIRIEGVDGALLIPSDALTQTSSASYVYTSVDETTGELGGMKEVTVGMNNGSYVEITSGLNEGDTVYYTQKQQNSFSFNKGGMSGGMSGGDLPSGMTGGDRTGGMGGERPSGNMPSGGSGSMPSFGN